MTESNLCECEVPIKVVGDIHAQFQDMNRLFDLIGRVPQEKFLFLGDYVDRGPQGIEVLCMHGGLSPELNHLDVIRNIPRPCEPLDRGLLIDLTWSDPTNKGDGWFHSIRGISYMFGKGVVQQACQMLGIDLVIRAHQVVQDGYEMMAGRRLITVFSAPNYCGQFTNAAAIVAIDEDMEISFQQLKMQIAPNLAPKAKPAPAIACDTNTANAQADKEYIKPFTGFKGKAGSAPPSATPAEDKTQMQGPSAEQPSQSQQSQTKTPEGSQKEPSASAVRNSRFS
ncbi:unnamed protein product [Nippostrongylus brasiliensis]|uniref:SER_THR_PHOSPHATASE domain-containing protein n=1 Tax=Nippostrongylus brasiliensis TaxID=27835 RepID=A0A0N4XXB4_NIPBR|nr:unnamed protein product [Nippostrongylus brasiliensis]